MRKGKQKGGSPTKETNGRSPSGVRKTNRSTAGHSKRAIKILEKDPLALPKKRQSPPKAKAKAKASAVRTKAARKQTEPAEYEVEKIVDHRPVGCDMSYRIRWKGYAAKDDTWQLEHELNCNALLKEYKEAIRAALAKPSKKTATGTPGKRGRPPLAGAKGSPKKAKAVAKGRVEKKRGRPAGSKKPEWEVEEVVAVRKTEKGKEEFLIKWKGYSSEENTWEPAANVANCKAAIKRFRQSQGDDEKAAINTESDAAKEDEDSQDAEEEKENGANGTEGDEEEEAGKKEDE